MSDIGKNLLLWLVIAAVLLTVFNNFNLSAKAQVVPYSDFVKAVNQNQINEVQIQGDKIKAVNKAGEEISVTWLQNDQKLMDDLLNNNVRTIVLEEEKQSFWMQLLVASFPILIIIAVFMLFMRQMQGGSGVEGIR